MQRHPITYTYDKAGQVTQMVEDGWTSDYQYDQAGNRTLFRYPYRGTLGSATNDGFYLIYDYDLLNRIGHIRENGAASGLGVLATYVYDELSRPTSVTFGNGTTRALTYAPNSILASLALDLDGAATPNDNLYTLAYNQIPQIASVTTTNAAFVWDGYANVNRGYTTNGLDQYMTSGSQALSYDDNGNLAGDQSWAFGYDAENQLTSASAPAANLTLAYRYDALGRMDRRQRGSETASDYRYDGQSLIAAHDAGANPHTQRYVHGAGVDAPIVEYTLQSGAYTRKWYAADHKGSVVATTDDAGATTALYAYGDYGEVAPGASGGPAFRYTGQRRDPDSGLYYYKARWYSANLGRFLQTDPIGTEDQINLYAYVGNDPINLSDPTGMYTVGGNSYFSNPGSAGTGYGSPSNNAVFTLTGGATPGIVTPPGVRARDAGPDIVAVALQAATDVVNGMAPRGGYPPWLKGIMIHAAFAVEIKAMNRAGLPVDAEVSYKNGVVVPYGTPGSVRADAVTGNINRPAAIYEMKTGVTTMSRIDLENYMRNLPPGTPVHQLLIKPATP